MKLILYSLNALLLIAIVALAKHVKNFEGSPFESQMFIAEAGDPVMETVKLANIPTIPSEQISTRSVFHPERTNVIKREVTAEELEKKVKNEMAFILKGIASVGEDFAFIIAEEKKAVQKNRPRIPQPRTNTQSKTEIKMYKVGDTVEGSSYKVKEIAVDENGESFVTLQSGSSTLKLMKNDDQAKEHAKKTRASISQQLQRQRQRTKPPIVTPKKSPKTPKKQPKVPQQDKVI